MTATATTASGGTTVITIPAEERGMAVIAHLSGLAGYIVPLCGIVVPIIIWATRKEQPVIVAIARQAVLLNIAVFIGGLVAVIMFLTFIFIPFAAVLGLILCIGSVGLPVYGALKADKGEFYKYPVVGSNP